MVSITSTAPAVDRISQLPMELKHSIVRSVQPIANQKALSLANQEWRCTTEPILWEFLKIETSSYESRVEARLSALLALSRAAPSVIRYVRHLVCFDHDWSSGGAPPWEVKEILDSISDRQLRVLEYHHSMKFQDVCNALCERQPSLRTVKRCVVSPAGLSLTPLKSTNCLRQLKTLSLVIYHEEFILYSEYLEHILRDYSELKNLKLQGRLFQKILLWKDWTDENDLTWFKSMQPKYVPKVQTAPVPRPLQVECLELVSLPLPIHLLDYFAGSAIKELTLRLCMGTTSFLRSIAERAPAIKIPHLTKLTIIAFDTGFEKIEDYPAFLAGMKGFLTSFTGLRELCFASPRIDAGVVDAIIHHRNTLEILYLDNRGCSFESSDEFFPSFPDVVRLASRCLQLQQLRLVIFDRPESAAHQAKFETAIRHIGALPRLHTLRLPSFAYWVDLGPRREVAEFLDFCHNWYGSYSVISYEDVDGHAKSIMLMMLLANKECKLRYLSIGGFLFRRDVVECEGVELTRAVRVERWPAVRVLEMGT